MASLPVEQRELYENVKSIDEFAEALGILDADEFARRVGARPLDDLVSRDGDV